jgi:pyrroline-5-carboxylate reductase
MTIAQVLKGNIGFMGAGNMTQSLVSSFVSSKVLDPKQIYISNRTQKKLERVVEDLGVNPANSNEELIDKCTLVILAMKPQDIQEAIEPISSSFTESHIVISLAAGFGIPKLKKIVPQVKNWVRVMPNTPVSIGKGVVGYCIQKEDAYVSSIIESLFSSIGIVTKVDEGEMFEALMVATSSGVGFIFELMLYWQEWLEEHGFSSEKARELTTQTFLGASHLAKLKINTSIEELQNKVTSKKGVTASGLDSMRELDVERAMRYSFEKAVLRDREIAKTNS